MAERDGNTKAPRAVLWAVYLVTAAVGAWLGYDFGQVLGGMLLGVVLAVMGALICSIVAGDLAERMIKALARRGPSP